MDIERRVNVAIAHLDLDTGCDGCRDAIALLQLLKAAAAAATPSPRRAFTSKPVSRLLMRHD